MSEFKADDPDDDQEDRKKTDDVVGVAKEDDAAKHGSCSADACPNSVGGSNRNRLHCLRDGEKAKDDKNYCDQAGNKFGKALAVFEGDGEADLKKAR